MKDTNKAKKSFLDLGLMALLFGLFALPLTSFGLTNFRVATPQNSNVLSEQDVRLEVVESSESTESTSFYQEF